MRQFPSQLRGEHTIEEAEAVLQVERQFQPGDRVLAQGLDRVTIHARVTLIEHYKADRTAQAQNEEHLWATDDPIKLLPPAGEHHVLCVLVFGAYAGTVALVDPPHRGGGVRPGKACHQMLEKQVENDGAAASGIQ